MIQVVDLVEGSWWQKCYDPVCRAGTAMYIHKRMLSLCGVVQMRRRTAML
jgi:hypothetical protein